MSLINYYGASDILIIVYNLDFDDDSLWSYYEEAYLHFHPKPIIIFLRGSICPNLTVYKTQYSRSHVVFLGKDLHKDIHEAINYVYPPPILNNSRITSIISLRWLHNVVVNISDLTKNYI
jgi:hypothetical protein